MSRAGSLRAEIQPGFLFYQADNTITGSRLDPPPQQWRTSAKLWKKHKSKEKRNQPFILGLLHLDSWCSWWRMTCVSEAAPEGNTTHHRLMQVQDSCGAWRGKSQFSHRAGIREVELDVGVQVIWLNAWKKRKFIKWKKMENLGVK